MPSPKKSPKDSPKKGGRASPGKGKPVRDEEASKRAFARKRYDTMDAIFVQKGPNVSIYAKSIHLYEIWNNIPPVESFSNSNSTKKSSPKTPKGSPNKKASPKGKGADAKSHAGERDDIQPQYEPALITGIVVTNKKNLRTGKLLYLDVNADFQYLAHGKVPPFPDTVGSRCRCFHETKLLAPVTFDTDKETSQFCQMLISEFRKKMPRGTRFFPFEFNVTRKPDSVFFTRPYHAEFHSGLFWNLHAYLTTAPECAPLPDEEITMEFYKYTITPSLLSISTRDPSSMEYIRYSTLDDTGDLVLQAKLDRDVYYQGQDINVQIQVENGSSRHVIHSVTVFVEQTYRLFHQFPHDSSIPLGEVVLRAGEGGLPIAPRSKMWTKTVTVKPVYDQTKYNLAIDGKMPVDGKVFLANSTVIMLATQVPVVIEEAPAATERGRSPKGSPGTKNKSPKSQSPKGSSKSPKKASTVKETPAVEQKEEKPIPLQVVTMKEVNSLTNKQSCRSIFIAYDVVVRLNIRTPQGDESGHPTVRVPFVLTKETRFLDKLTNPPPPTWGTIKPH